jgi:hypothetical protein
MMLRRTMSTTGVQRRVYDFWRIGLAFRAVQRVWVSIFGAGVHNRVLVIYLMTGILVRHRLWRYILQGLACLRGKICISMHLRLLLFRPGK